jgi:VIT1/CCC1 family predicted Fe2+/Mn2+ transporter
MGLGGYLAAKSDCEHYASERAREYYEIAHMEAEEVEETYHILLPYGLDREILHPVVERLRTGDPDKWVEFMMRFELGLEQPDPRRSWISALTIGCSYFLGGLVPLFPYLLVKDTFDALLVSAAVTLIALFVFGIVKSRLVNPEHVLSSALQTMLVGAVAASCAYGFVKLFPEADK